MIFRKSALAIFTQDCIKHSFVRPAKTLQPCKKDLLHQLFIGGQINNGNENK